MEGSSFLVLNLLQTAEFGCRCEGSDSTPSWYINKLSYPALDLPNHYEYISERSSLVVYNVTLSLNQTTTCIYDV